MANWLDKYENGGEYLGTTNVGRNYSPAWGGQFEGGGTLQPPMAGANQTVPMAQDGKKQLSQFLPTAEEFQPSAFATPFVNLERLQEDFGITAIPGGNFTVFPNEKLNLNANVSVPLMVSKRGIQGLGETNAFDYNIGAGYQLGRNDYLGVNYGNNQGTNLTYRHTLGNRKKKKAEVGTSLPGSVGFTYARTQGIPSEGPYAKKTMPSAQNGKEMQFYQQGLDWTPRNISEYGSEIPMAQGGDNIPWWMKKQSDVSQRGNQNIKTEVAAQKSKEKQAQQKVEKLKQVGYTEKEAKRAVQNKSKAGERDVKEYDRVMTRAQAHSDYQPETSFAQMKALSEDNSLRSSILRGANLLTNTGNPVTDLVTGVVTSPGRSFANLTTDAQKQYFNSEASGLENAINLGSDLLEVFPTAVIQGASKAAKQVPKMGEYLTTQTPLKNAYKINPWAFKANPEAYYRGIGKTGLDDAIKSRVLRGNPNSRFSGDLYLTDDFNEAQLFSKGYVAEIPKSKVVNLGSNPTTRSRQNIFVSEDPISINDATIYKQDWLRGYKPIEVPRQKKGGVVKDNNGYWNPDNWGRIVEIDSPNITMQGVNQDLIGISDEGDVQYMEPGKDYKFKGKKVKEYPVGKDGVSVNRADEYPLKKLDNLLNFTNYNKPKAKTGWLSKYE